jgi:hypothetical protein
MARPSLATLPALLLLLLVGVGDAAKPPTRPAPSEPPLQFELDVNGKTHSIQAQRPLEIEVGGQKVRLQLKPLPYRVFDHQKIRFQYPAFFGWEVDDSDSDVTIYTLDGNDTVLILMRYGELQDVGEIKESLVGTMVAQYGGKQRARQSAASINLAGKKIEGVRLDIRVVGEKLRQDIFVFEGPNGVVGLIVQDSPTDRGETTEETKQAVQMLEKTFELLPK